MSWSFGGDLTLKVAQIDNNTLSILSDSHILEVTIINEKKRVYAHKCYLGVHKKEVIGISMLKDGDYFVVVETVEGFTFQKMVKLSITEE